MEQEKSEKKTVPHADRYYGVFRGKGRHRTGKRCRKESQNSRQVLSVFRNPTHPSILPNDRGRVERPEKML